MGDALGMIPRREGGVCEECFNMASVEQCWWSSCDDHMWSLCQKLVKALGEKLGCGNDFPIIPKLLMGLWVRRASSGGGFRRSLSLYFPHLFSIFLPSFLLDVVWPWQFYLSVVYRRSLPGLIHLCVICVTAELPNMCARRWADESLQLMIRLMHSFI